jgi:hypothetical protein
MSFESGVLGMKWSSVWVAVDLIRGWTGAIGATGVEADSNGALGLCELNHSAGGSRTTPESWPFSTFARKSIS